MISGGIIKFMSCMSDYGPIPQKNVVKDCGDYECVRVCVPQFHCVYSQIHHDFGTLSLDSPSLWPKVAVVPNLAEKSSSWSNSIAIRKKYPLVN